MLSFFFSKSNRIAPIVALLSCFMSCFMSSAYSYASTENAHYLRGGVGVTFSQDTEFTDEDCRSNSPAALFGCSSGNDGNRIGAYGGFGDSELIEMGFGYLWNEWFQTELSLAYRPHFQFDGQSNFNQIDTDFRQTVTADVKNFSGMVVGVIKPLPLFHINDWFVEPLVMAGLGVAHNRIDRMVYTFPRTTTTTPNGNHSDFAWTVGAGFAYALSAGIDLELLYRYSELGKVYTDADTMEIVFTPTDTLLTDSIVINRTEAALNVNEIIVSVVWYF
jgi:opacity protein-like surface antigen